jgi:hypothetical protein
MPLPQDKQQVVHNSCCSRRQQQAGQAVPEQLSQLCSRQGWVPTYSQAW